MHSANNSVNLVEGQEHAILNQGYSFDHGLRLVILIIYLRQVIQIA